MAARAAGSAQLRPALTRSGSRACRPGPRPSPACATPRHSSPRRASGSHRPRAASVSGVSRLRRAPGSRAGSAASRAGSAASRAAGSAASRAGSARTSRPARAGRAPASQAASARASRPGSAASRASRAGSRAAATGPPARPRRWVRSSPAGLAARSSPTAAGAKPVGTDCGAAKLYGLKASTLDASTFCSKTTRAHIVVWGYQFDSASDYQAGLAHINHFVGFDKVTPGTTCPPPSGSTEGKVGWHAKHNPKYFSRSGQDIECLVDAHEPVLIWTMPTQDVFFVGEDQAKSTPIKTIISWWETLTYG